jgi:hypothetical protein
MFIIHPLGIGGKYVIEVREAWPYSVQRDLRGAVCGSYVQIGFAGPRHGLAPRQSEDYPLRIASRSSLGHCPSRTVQVEINRGVFSTGALFEWYARSN